MPVTCDPEILNPTPGKLIVQIVEQLGGMTKGGIFIPESVADGHNKDTAYGRVVKLGAPPEVRLSFSVKKMDRACDWIPWGKPWPEDYEPITVGDVVLFPRDVPIAVVHETGRYAIVQRQELICVLEGDTSDFDVVPWDAKGHSMSNVGR